jgi:hypothetical protein
MHFGKCYALGIGAGFEGLKTLFHPSPSGVSDQAN